MKITAFFIRDKYNMEIEIREFVENHFYILHSESLDLMNFGKTKDDARKNFKSSMKILFEYEKENMMLKD